MQVPPALSMRARAAARARARTRRSRRAIDPGRKSSPTRKRYPRCPARTVAGRCRNPARSNATESETESASRAGADRTRDLLDEGGMRLLPPPLRPEASVLRAHHSFQAVGSYDPKWSYALNGMSIGLPASSCKTRSRPSVIAPTRVTEVRAAVAALSTAARRATGAVKA